MSVSTPSIRSFLQIQLLRLEDWTIRQHLRRTEQRLRHKSHPELTPHQRKARQQNLDSLRDYWQAGQFPRNHVEKHQRRPVFIDERDTHCAVGYLVAQSGYAQTARQIAKEANTALLADMHVPELQTWVEQCGLTSRELATIQPTYCPSGDYEIPQVIIYTAGHVWRWAFMVGLLGVPFATINTIHLGRGHTLPRFIPLIGFIIGLIVSALGIGLLGLIATDQAETISLVSHLHTDYFTLASLAGWIVAVLILTITGYATFLLNRKNSLSQIWRRVSYFVGFLIVVAVSVVFVILPAIDQVFEEVAGSYRSTCMWIFLGYSRTVREATYTQSFVAVGLGLLYMLLSSSVYFSGRKFAKSAIAPDNENALSD